MFGPIKIYSKFILTIFLMLMPSYRLESKLVKTHHHPRTRGYVDWHSWAAYLCDHPGYKSYEPVTDIKKNGCHWGAWITFPQKIEAIQARVGNFSSPLELFRSKDFLVMYKHPGYYREAFLNYIADKRYTLTQKKIAIYANMNFPLSPFWKSAYELYQQEKIDLPLLELLIAISLSNKLSSYNLRLEFLENKYKDEYRWLQEIKNNIPETSSLYKGLQAILDKRFPASWNTYQIAPSGGYSWKYRYYQAPFKLYDIVTAAVRDKEYLHEIYGNSPRLDSHPYFLMVMEHPVDYYPCHFEFGPRQSMEKENGNGIDILRFKSYTDEEKSMAIFGMSQLGLQGTYESSDYYAYMIGYAIGWYKLGRLSVRHLLELFICNFPTFYKYPFFIIDYKDKRVQEALNKFIAAPTIPEGLKEVARKVKNGTLATKEEMDYMRGYRTFRKTHFTFYETIVPHG